MILVDRLRAAATALNPGVPAAQVDWALERIGELLDGTPPAVEAE